MHYAAAIFRYERECAVKFKEHAIFVCMDDKYHIKVGEPNYFVAAAERGRQILVKKNESFEIGDHDFTKFPVVDLPDGLGIQVEFLLELKKVFHDRTMINN